MRHEATGLQGSSARRDVHPIPRMGAHAPAGLDLRAGPDGRHAAPRVRLPRLGARRQQRARKTARSSWPRTTSRTSTTSSPASTSAGRSSSWRSRSSTATRSWTTSSGSEASSRCAAAITTRRRSSRPPPCSSAEAAWACTARAGARGPGRLGEPKAGRRAARARIRCARRAPGDPRLGRGSRVEAPQVPQGDAPVRRADQLPAQPVALARGGARRVRARSSTA